MSLDYRLEAEAATPRFATLSHARVAFPLDLCYLASHDVDFERSVSPYTACRSLARNFVMPRRQRHPKVPLVIRGKRCDLALLIFHRESRVREWGNGSISPHGSGPGGIERNDSFDPRFRTRLRLTW